MDIHVDIRGYLEICVWICFYLWIWILGPRILPEFQAGTVFVDGCRSRIVKKKSHTFVRIVPVSLAMTALGDFD